MPKINFSLKMAADSVAELIIYEEVGGWWGITAQEVSRHLKTLRAEHGTINTLNVRINSPGGDVFEGTAIYNLLKQDSAQIHVFIDGLAASMGSVIAMAGDKITIGESAAIMIHNPAMMAWGESEDLRKGADLLDQVKTALMTTYKKRTGKDDDELAALMNAETWYFGQEAVDAGFADAVFEAPAMAASLRSESVKNYSGLPEKAKAFFQPPENQSPTTEGAAPQPTAKEENIMPQHENQSEAGGNPAPVATTTAAVTSVEPVATAQDRNDSIKSVFAAFNGQHNDLLIDCLSDAGITMEQAQAKLLAKLGAQSTPSAAPTSAAIHVSNGRVVYDGLLNALEARVFKDVTAEKDNSFKSYNLLEMARASLQENGISMSAYGDRMSMVGAAFTHSSSDFGSVLADVAHKALLRGWDETPETFTQWTRTGVLTDFKASHRVGLNSFPSLGKVEEGAEYTHGTVSDRGEQIMLATYGKLFAITRQAIINDDLSVFTRLPQAMGRAAARTVGDMVYAILTDNAKMSDGKALFHADHKNMVTGGLDIDNLGKARTLMRTHKDGDAHLSIQPGYLLTPVALEGTAGQILRSEADPSKTNSKAANPVYGMATPISDPRLDSKSSTDSYLVAGDMYDTIEVAYLDGNSAPRLEQQEGWNVDGTQFKVSLDAGVSPLDFRSFVRLGA